MPIKDKKQLQEYFKTGKKPTQQQFWDFLDSYYHKNEFPTNMNYIFKNVVKSTSGLTEVFPTNPNVGDLYSLRDDNDKVLKTWQYNGEEWVIIYDFVYNFSVQYTKEDIGNFDTEEKFKYLYGDNAAITFSNYKINKTTNIISANLIQDYSVNRNAFTLLGVEKILKLSNDYAFSISLDDQYIFDNNFIINFLDNLIDVNIGIYKEDTTKFEKLNKIEISNNKSLRDVIFRKQYGDTIDSIVLENNGINSKKITISIETKFRNLKLTNNNNTDFLLITTPINKIGEKLDLTGDLNLSNQTINRDFTISNIDFTNSKSISYPKLTTGVTFNINNCIFTQGQFTDLYNYLLNSTEKTITINNSSERLFSKEQKTTLEGLGYTVNQ